MTTATDFDIGALVRHIHSSDKGTVIGNDLKGRPNIVAIEWSPGTSQAGMLELVHVDLLDLIDLEAQFEAVKLEVNVALKKAANLISEAARLAKAGGIPLIGHDDYDHHTSKYDIQELERAMQNAGWSTSSWYC